MLGSSKVSTKFLPLLVCSIFFFSSLSLAIPAKIEATPKPPISCHSTIEPAGPNMLIPGTPLNLHCYVDGGESKVSLSTSGLPTGASIISGQDSSSPAHFEVAWTPAPEQVGAYQISLVAKSSKGSCSCDYNLSVGCSEGAGTGCGNQAPICNAGGPFTIPCSGERVSIPLQGSTSIDPDGDPLTYTWQTNCPNAEFYDPATGTTTGAPFGALSNAVDPILTFDSHKPNGSPLVCDLRLRVDDPLGGHNACRTLISVEQCNFGCDGIVNSGLEFDICGICGGDGTSCLGCDGLPNSGVVADECGICGGDNSTCKDCAGVPNGSAVLDPCGVCNGDGTSCADCSGVPNGSAKLDKCGVCDGDGTTCECNLQDLSLQTFAIDGFFQSQSFLFSVLMNRVNKLEKLLGKQAYSQLAESKLLGISAELLNEGWTSASVDLPKTNFVQCGINVNCAPFSTLAITTKLSGISTDYVKLSKKVVKTSAKKLGIKRNDIRYNKFKQVLRRIKTFDGFNKDLIAKQYPPLVNQCVLP